MRDFGDYMAAREFKQYTVDDLRRYGFDLRLAFEDDRRNLEMFRAEGIPSVYIHSGYFEGADNSERNSASLASRASMSARNELRRPSLPCSCCVSWPSV